MDRVKKIIFSFYLVSFLVLSLIGGILVYQFNHQDLAVYFFDVGQGDAILIRTPVGHNIVIDGGPDNGVVYRLGHYLPFYSRTIDLLILTHPDSDHLTGLNEVLTRYQVKNILVTGNSFYSATYDQWLELIAQKNINVLIAGRINYITLGNNLNLEVLYPITSLFGKEIKEINSASVVARLVYGQTSFLFTGDATKEVETEIVDYYHNLQSTVLKIGHHGSDTSSGAEFLAEVDPALAVISVGQDNKFGHPKPAVINRLNQAGILTVLTSQLGDIMIFSNGSQIWYQGLKKD